MRPWTVPAALSPLLEQFCLAKEQTKQMVPTLQLNAGLLNSRVGLKLYLQSETKFVIDNMVTLSNFAVLLESDYFVWRIRSHIRT